MVMGRQAQQNRIVTKKVGDKAAAEPVTIIHFSRYEDRLRAMRERGKAT
jgi:hypothetical protein